MVKRNVDGLLKYAEEKGKIASEKVDKAIRNLFLLNESVNFNSIAQASGVSKAFLYNNEDIRKRIETLRNQQINQSINQRAKTDKTSKSKDIIIASKDKRIRELEDETRKLKEQLETLRGRLYQKM